MEKSPEAFRTISEVADWLGTPAHVLRFWESKFTQVKPIKRAGGRRYYRPSDMALLGGLKKLLHEDGLSIKAAQSLLREQGIRHVAAMSPPLDDGSPAEGEVIEIAAEVVAEETKPAIAGLPPLSLREAPEPDEPERVSEPDDNGQPELPFLHRSYEERMPQARPDREPMIRTAAEALDTSTSTPLQGGEDMPLPEPEPLKPAPLAELRAAIAAMPTIDRNLRTTLAHRLVVLRDRMTSDRTA